MKTTSFYYTTQTFLFKLKNLFTMNSTKLSSIFLSILCICFTLLSFDLQAQDPSTDRWVDSGNDVVVNNPGNGVIKIENSLGRYTEIGSKNGSWSHIITTAPRFFFNKEVRVNTGRIGSYNGNLYLRTGAATRMTMLNSNGNVGINTLAPTTKLDVEGDGKFTQTVADGDATLYIDFSNAATATNPAGGDITSGIEVQSSPITNKGFQVGVKSNTSTTTTNTLHNGNSQGRLALSSSWNAGGGFIGVAGEAYSQNLSATNFQFSSTIGGNFVGGADGSTPLNLASTDWYLIGGMRGILNGEINGSIGQGCIAAVIGEDNNTGTAESYAGLFKGKGCFTDLVKIGNVSTPVGYKLYVEEGILTEKLQVALKNSTDWADYVFAEDYELLPLDKVAEFVQENKHLPNVPSAEEVAANGINVAKMDAKLLEKIEELTLYIIQLKESNDELQSRVEGLEK